MQIIFIHSTSFYLCPRIILDIHCMTEKIRYMTVLYEIKEFKGNHFIVIQIVSITFSHCDHVMPHRWTGDVCVRALIQTGSEAVKVCLVWQREAAEVSHTRGDRCCSMAVLCHHGPQLPVWRAQRHHVNRETYLPCRNSHTTMAFYFYSLLLCKLADQTLDFV